MLRRLTPAVGLALLCATVPTATAGPSSDRTVTVRVLAINDFHGNLEPPSGSAGRLGQTPVGGLAYLATHLSRLAQEQPNSIVVSAGDNIGATPLLSALFHDEPTIEGLAAAGLALSAAGNHEFDEGWRELQRLQRGGCHPVDGCQDGTPFAGAAFHFLAANVHVRTAAPSGVGDTLFPAYEIREFDGVKVGFIGTSLRTTANMVTPESVAGLTFEDEARAANRAVAALRRQGVRAIVLLIHQGAEGDGVDSAACGNLSVEIRDVIRRLSPEIDVVVSGHTHRAYDCTVRQTLLTSTDAYGRRITRIDLTINRRTGQVVARDADNITVTRDVPPDPRVSAIIDRYRPLAVTEARRPVGEIAGPITEAPNVAAESALGDVVADGMLEAASPTHAGGAMIALMNPGGIRTDLVRGDDSATAGVVTYGDVFKVLPFGNHLLVKTMTGEALLRLLEQQFDNPAPGEHTVLQVSRGFTYRYAVSRPAGQRVDRASVRLNGERIVPTAKYRVVMPDFVWSAGDRFTVALEGTDLTPGLSDVEALARYIKAHSPLAAPTPNRLAREN